MSPGQATPSLEELASVYGRLVSSICRRMIRDEEAARDAAQLVWAEIVRSYPTFRGDAKVSTWIYTIARRIAVAHGRRERVYSMRFLNDYARSADPVQPLGLAADRSLWARETCDKCLTGILHCVDAETRLAHVLRDIAGLEYREIATIVGKGEANARQMISRSRRKVTAFLRGRCAIYNPDGDCRCRMKPFVASINLAEEYRRVRAVVRQAHFLKQAEVLFPPKNYWADLR